MKCVIVFPATAALDEKCPRCKGEAGDHPAPITLVADPEASVFDRPTLRVAVTYKKMAETMDAATLDRIVAGQEGVIRQHTTLVGPNGEALSPASPARAKRDIAEAQAIIDTIRRFRKN